MLKSILLLLEKYKIVASKTEIIISILPIIMDVFKYFFYLLFGGQKVFQGIYLYSQDFKLKQYGIRHQNHNHNQSNSKKIYIPL